MEFTVLGPLAVRDRRSLVLGGPRQQAVLAVLLVSANRVVPVDRLIDEIWGSPVHSEVRDTLQAYVSNLRRVLGSDRIERVADGYRLLVGPGELDSDSFQEEADKALRLLDSAPSDAHELYARALGRWQGRAYQGIDTPSVSLEASRLSERRLAAVENHLRARLALGHHHEVTGELHELCEQHPLREGLWALSMLALYRDERQAEALAAYQRLRTLLGEELGIEPSPKLRFLEEQILLQDPDLDLIPTIPNNLPAPLTSFIGRHQELVEVGKLLADHRLVTLTGVGGSGKTRLALEVANTALTNFPDGVWLVELARIKHSSAVPQAIANTLGIPLPAGVESVQALAKSLKDLKTLLMLDNFEHLIEASPFVSTILAAAPDLRVLATSRERLHLSGEHVLRVPPLAPADATNLFFERAKAAQHEFTINTVGASHVEAICHDLDGLPLPIELVAARVDILPPAALRERISSGIASLADGPRDLPDRQRTLTKTIDWSYNLLEPDHQALFATLAIFDGGCSLEAVEAVCGPNLSQDVLRALEALTDKSLILQGPGPDGGPRFFMIETIHEYAFDRLVEQFDLPSVRQAHCDYYVDFMEQSGPRLRYGGGASRWWEILNTELGNLRAALEWAFSDGDRLQGARLLGSCHFHEENEAWSELERWENEAYECADSLEPLPRARLYLALARSHHGHRDSRELCEQALEWATVAGDQFLAVRARFDLALTYLGEPESYEQALDSCRKAVNEARAAQAPGLIAHALNALGELARSNGDDETAFRAYDEALPLSRQVGNQTLTVLLLLNLAFVAEHRGHDSAAEDLAFEALSEARALKDQTLVAFGLEGVAMAAASAGKGERAARLLGAAEQAHAALGITFGSAEPLEYERTHARLAEFIPSADLEALQAEGRAMTIAKAVAYALEVPPAGRNSREADPLRSGDSDVDVIGH